ncbi:uncharacterized protein LOC129456849 [Periophthalmus magnuspinnatus]|uniref:uncharacterized protein LOC129456849 n=1 Tax=Periophthalmus magnuspinnatus TaxID=409849 RepID=UPI002436D88B|nr:uncharacterized protein LOC129456849 [Periophthalmus magnuspinnatus]
MSKGKALRAVTEKRLTAAGYEEDQRKRGLLESVLSPRVVLLRAGVQTSPLSSPGPGLNHSLKQEIPEISVIKEEPEEHSVKQEELSIKQEEDTVKQEEEQLPVCVLESSVVSLKTEEPSLFQQTEPREKTQEEDIGICTVAVSPLALTLCSYSDRITTVRVIIPTSAPSQSTSEKQVLRENSVSSLQQNPFAKRSIEEQKRVIELGPDQPDLCLQQRSGDRGRTYVRGFSRSSYEKRNWLTGCNVKNAFFCFPCLLFNCTGTETTWTSTGVSDLRHLSEKCKRHDNCRSHVDNCFRLSVFGRTNIAAQSGEGYRASVQKHNEEVTKNRHILSRIIDRVKFCGAFEVASHGQDKSESSNIHNIFHHSLVDFVSSPDAVLKEHIDNSTVFNGMSKTIENELLDCMLSVTRDEIVRQIKDSDFVSIQVNETTDMSMQSHLVLLLRYLDKMHQVHERFFTFIKLQSATAESITAALEEQLATVLPDQKDKLISQSYNGVSLMGIQRRIQEQYPNAHNIHCYAHQLDSITRQATAHIPQACVFFSDLDGFERFFSKSPKRTCVLIEALVHRLHTSDHIRWNTRAVNTVFENKEELIRCFEKIRDCGDFDADTEQEAEALGMLLESTDFTFFLQLFYQILPHVDVLYSKLQKKDMDCFHIKQSIQQFEEGIQKIRDSVHSVAEEQSSGAQPEKRPRMIDPEEHGKTAEEICDAVLRHITERFSFTDHLIAATLLRSDRFEEYNRTLPEQALCVTLKAYPCLTANRLKTELSVIYSKEDLRVCPGAIDLIHVFAENNLLDVFQETVKLLKIVITTPMTTAEAERCCSTLKRVKTFLTNSMNQDRLNALAMLFMENQLITHMWDFNQRVIEKFACQKDRSAKFLYK